MPIGDSPVGRFAVGDAPQTLVTAGTVDSKFTVAARYRILQQQLDGDGAVFKQTLDLTHSDTS